MRDFEHAACWYAPGVDCCEDCRRDCGWYPSEMARRMLRLLINDTATKNGLKTLRVGRKHEQEERN